MVLSENVKALQRIAKNGKKSERILVNLDEFRKKTEESHGILNQILILRAENREKSQWIPRNLLNIPESPPDSD